MSRFIIRECYSYCGTASGFAVSVMISCRRCLQIKPPLALRPHLEALVEALGAFLLEEALKPVLAHASDWSCPMTCERGMLWPGMMPQRNCSMISQPTLVGLLFLPSQEPFFNVFCTLIQFSFLVGWLLCRYGFPSILLPLRNPPMDLEQGLLTYSSTAQCPSTSP